MKLKSKHKWIGVALLFILSWVGMVMFPQLGFALGFPLAICSFMLLMATLCYGVFGMIEARVFERLGEWLQTDDV